MTPRTSYQNLLDRSGANSVATCQRAKSDNARHVLATDGDHLLRGQLCVRTVGSAGVVSDGGAKSSLPFRASFGLSAEPVSIAQSSSASLRGHIGEVLSLSADKEVIGTDTGRVVTVVQNRASRSYRSVLQLPCDAVRSVATERAVSLLCSRTRPQPAPIATLNVLPESIRGCAPSTQGSLSIGAVIDPGGAPPPPP